MSIVVPKKPFPDYKWRWAVFTPTENLNRSTVFLGVLRALCKYEGQPPSSPKLAKALKVVEKETKSTVNLARSPSRNLIRNSGQYWKALGLLAESVGEVKLTSFGRRVAEGGITKGEFASSTVKTLELPNRRIDTQVSDWDVSKLKIKPLELILHILGGLQHAYGDGEAFITHEELVKVVIPLAGAKADVDDHVDALHAYREGLLDLEAWPDCAPGSNDRRMAREFLLFLSNYGFCQRIPRKGNISERFVLSGLSYQEVEQLVKFDLKGDTPTSAIKKLRKTDLPEMAERKRVMREMVERPHQAKFRDNILIVYGSKCLLTGVNIEAVLEAAHIRPVRLGGNDKDGNGICLRSDVHLLYDTGHLRINRTGSLHLSEVAAQKSNYGALPTKIKVPSFVDVEFWEWRWKYC